MAETVVSFMKRMFEVDLSKASPDDLMQVMWLAVIGAGRLIGEQGDGAMMPDEAPEPQAVTS